MKTVWKFPLDITDDQDIKCPAESVPLFVGQQNDQPALWMLVESAEREVQRHVSIHGTGHDTKGTPYLLQYVGSFIVHDGAFVGHVWLGADQ